MRGRRRCGRRADRRSSSLTGSDTDRRGRSVVARERRRREGHAGGHPRDEGRARRTPHAPARPSASTATCAVPVCKEWDAAEAPDVIAGVVKPGQAKLDLRLWAILGPNSEAAHRAGYAAMQQNKLWLYATIVYYNQGNEQQNWFDDAFARSVAMAAGLDLKQFDADRKSDAADQMIDDGRGRRAGPRPDRDADDRRRQGQRRTDVLRRRADRRRHRERREVRRGVRAERIALIVLAALATAIGAYLIVRAIARPATSVPGRRRRVRDRAAQPLRRAGRHPGLDRSARSAGWRCSPRTFLRAAERRRS